MANRINTFLLKRSSIPGKIPSPGQLLLGEIALNSADAMLYTSGTTANSILPIGWDRISRTGDTMSGALYGPTISATTYLNLPISIVNVSNLFSTGLIDTGTNVDSITYSNFFGEGAGSSALYASYSNFLGYQAGYNATYANDSNFIGQQAGYGATFSNDSNFIGTHAGSGATNAHNSNFIGNEAGNNAISASDSNFMGHYAGNGATSAYNSNFFGLSAGHEAINAHQSNFIGNEAGTNADNADFSNFMGQLAGAFAVNARHSNFIGQNAGYQATEGEYSNFLGYNVGNGGVLGSLGSNNIIIGTNISLPSGTTSSLNLGGVLFGQNTYAITTGDPSIVAQTDGRIGINVVNPLEALHVAGNTLVDGNLMANTISATTYYNLPLDVKVTGSTLNPANYDFTLTRNDGVTITSNLGILSSDMVVTGGTYNINTGVVTFTNNSGGTFNVTGFTSGMTDTFTTGGTYSDGTTIFTKTNGGTYSVSGYTTPFTGGTVSGSTTFTNGLTTNTFSATTYLGLPTDIRVTGGTYGSGTTVFSNNTGGTFNITGYTYIPHLQYDNLNSTIWNYGYGNLSDNISFGRNALVSITNGNNNTAFGSASLSANTTGNYNAGIGTGSLKYNTTGVQNFGIGAYALHYNTTGNYNTGIGTAALQNNTNTERNVAIGGFSLYNNTGSRNIAIGFYAGSATKGSDNILFGANSNNVTDGLVSGSNNTIIGTSLSGVINGSNNTIFGKPTGLSSTTTNNIVIADGSGNIRFRDNNVNTILPRLAGSGDRMVIAGPNGELSSTTIFDTFVTGGTYSTGTAVFTNNTGGTFSVTGFSTSNGVTFTGGTVTGATIFTNGLTANTFSAATYLNLPNTSPISVISGSSLFSTGLFETGLNSSGVTSSNFFGSSTGFNATGASQSNFFGPQAGYNATNAAGSNFFGQFAGQSATNANNSNFLGNAAGNSATNASNSNFFGAGAGFIATNAYGSNFLGQNAGYQATSASQSNFMGQNAGYQATGASNSNFMGQNAGDSATGANYSNFLGNNAGYAATSAAGSNFIGLNAGFQATSAGSSNFMGISAGFQATNTSNSNFFGQEAGNQATNAFYSNFFGYRAGYAASGANYSNFLGQNAGYQAINAYYSNFMGQNAGRNATNASASNFIGLSAGLDATSAGSSNFMGISAGGYATNASNSNFFGPYAGYGATNANDSNFMGYYAGNNATGATNSNLFGYNVGNGQVLGSLGSNNIIIGTNISLPSGTTNSLNLGGVLFGKNTYATRTGDPSIVGQTNGRIGINVVTPTEALHVSGNTLIKGSLTANTFSATTYYNLPTDINVTGGTYSAGTAVFTNNTGGTFSVTGFSTSNGVTFTGGTVNGATIFTNGLTANTFSATSINKVDYMVFNTNTLSAATVPGTVYFDNTEHALSYNTSINQGVTVNLGQQNYVRVFNNSGSDIQRGKALEVLSAYSGLPSVTLAINKHTGFNIIGVSAEIIPNNSEGIAITYGIISNIEMTGITIGSFVYASDTIPGKLDDPSKYLNFPLTARTNQIGYVVQTGTTTGKLFVDIKNENSVLSLTDLERNVLEGNTLSTGLFEFTGMTTASTTTFNVASLKAWLIKNTYTYALLPDVQSINYTGGTNIPVINIATADSTYILINSGITITQQVTFPTPQERRENIYLGKINHPNRSTILNINNTADYDVSPMSSLRDLWSPIKLINQGIIPSPNGANLSFKTSAGVLWGNGINWHNNQLSPNNVNIAAKVPASFNYRTRTGGTSTSVSVIDPRHYDVGGVITSVGGAGSDDATNQRIYMYPTGVINVLYGQTRYANLTAAVAAIDSEDFIPYPNAESTGILIGVLSVRNDIGTDGQPLTNASYAKFTLVSKFGESFGGTGGLSTTTLQQAYDNSSNPEIVINAVLDGLTIQNGTGNADNVTRLLEGSNAAANVTSFIRADGYISGTTFQTNGTFLNNGGITATTVSATTYLNLPTSGGGTFTGGTVTGPTTFTNGLTANTISATTYYNLPLDVYVTGSTLNPGNYDFTLTRNDGVTITSNLGILSSDMTVTGGTYDINTGVVTFTNNSGGTFNVTGFTSGMTDTFTTGGTVSSGTATFTKSDGSIYSVSGFSIGNEYWSSGSGLNSVIQTGSNSLAGGTGALAGGSGNSANSQYSVALGINSIADGFEILPVKTQKTVMSGITMTSSDPEYGTYAVVFSGVNVSFEWYEYFYGPYSSENSFVIDDGVGNTYTLYDYDLYDIYFDGTDTYIAVISIPLTSYITISGSPYYDLPTEFERPAFIMGSNSVVTGGNSIVLGSNITGTSDNTTYVDYFNIKRFKNESIIFGSGAGLNAIGATNSNFFGQNAGYQATSAFNSNFFGNAAGSNATSAYHSNFFGNSAGNGATGALRSNFLGDGAGQNATNASNSNFLGQYAGQNATSANNANFLGNSAGNGATNAYGSNLFGFQAGNGATGASRSNFIGYETGYNAKNANDSNFLGNQAGYNATGSSSSNFIGPQAGTQASNASNSNFLGTSAGQTAFNAFRSNFMGQNAGISAINANNSNFFGNSAGNSATNANNSNLFGVTAGFQATNASGSTFMGTNAGYQATNSSNSNFLGQQAGYRATNASYSNLFGYNVGNATVLGTLGSNNIIIGTNISLPIATTNSINLGGVLFGQNTYSAITGNPSISAQTNGRIGINVVNPSQALHVSGNALINGSLTANTISATTYLNLPSTGGGDTLWSSGSGLNSVIQTGSNSSAGGKGALAGGSGNSANSHYSVALGINSIADGFEILPVKTLKTVVSAINMTSSDPNNGRPSVVFYSVDVSAEWIDYFFGPYGSENSFVINDGVGNTYTLYDYNLTDLYFDGTDTYIVDVNIPLTSYITISGSPYYNLPTEFESPAFIMGSNSVVTGGNSIVLGSNITGTSDNTTYVDYFNIKRFKNESIIFGSGAGLNATSAEYSNFLGYNAGYGATNASNSNLFGSQAGYQATNAQYSNLLGQSAGYGASGASSSNFLGYYAGYQATSANDSNFLGSSAGYQATNANYSNFLGQTAGYQAINASNSNFIGNNAGQYSTNASNSNFIGNNAGWAARNANNSNIFGFFAGYRATGASYSTLIGYRVSYSNAAYETIGSNNIIIGTNISLSSGTTNSINIGGVLFGRGTYSAITGNPSIAAQTTGRIGINVVNPSEALHVSGNTLINGNLTANTISATTYYNLPLDIKVTGGTYNAGTAVFTNNTGGTFSITGFSTSTGGGTTFTGGTVSGKTSFTDGLSANTITVNPPSGSIGLTVNLTHFTSGILVNTATSLESPMPITVSVDNEAEFTVNQLGEVNTPHLEATTIGTTQIFAGTYLNLPSSTFSGGTVTGPTTFTNGLTANTISATTFYGDGSYLTGIGASSFSGGTVTGPTTFTNGLTATTIEGGDLDFMMVSLFRTLYNY